MQGSGVPKAVPTGPGRTLVVDLAAPERARVMGDLNPLRRNLIDSAGRLAVELEAEMVTLLNALAAAP